MLVARDGTWVRWVHLVGVVALVLAAYFLVPVASDPRGGVPLRVAGSVLVLSSLGVGVAAQLRLAAIDDDRRVGGLIAAVVAVPTVFALAFYALEVHQPHQLDDLRTRPDALYFSATTMLTVGYGDVHAVGRTARVLVLVLVQFDVVFVATAGGLLTSRVRRAAAVRLRD